MYAGGKTHLCKASQLMSEEMSCLRAWWEAWIRRCCVPSEDRTGQGQTRRLRDKSLHWGHSVIGQGLKGVCVQRMAAVIRRNIKQSLCWQNMGKEFWAKCLTQQEIFHFWYSQCLHHPTILQLHIRFKSTSKTRLSCLSWLVSCSTLCDFRMTEYHRPGPGQADGQGQ